MLARGTTLFKAEQSYRRRKPAAAFYVRKERVILGNEWTRYDGRLD
jgi:hypothetical protein